MASDLKFAVLIDADNISDKYIKIILDEISNDGIATYKRIYGDWTSPSLGSWKTVLLDNSIQPIQQYSYTTGKNATDSAMIIDAMDILYTEHVDGFCLVSSDSDFTRLAARLRESGMIVVGMGEQKTPKAFISACNRFKYLDILAQPDQKQKAQKQQQKQKAVANSKTSASAPAPKSSEKPQAADDPLTMVRASIRAIATEGSDEDDWMFVGTVGNLLVKRHPDFDVRNFGFSKLTPFLDSLDLFEFKHVRTDDSGGKIVYVKLK